MAKKPTTTDEATADETGTAAPVATALLAPGLSNQGSLTAPRPEIDPTNRLDPATGGHVADEDDAA